MRHRRYYVCQYGAWWSFSRDMFHRFLIEGSLIGEYDLDDPKWHAKPVTNPRDTLFRYIVPLDFSREDFAETLKEFEETGEIVANIRAADTGRSD